MSQELQLHTDTNFHSRGQPGTARGTFGHIIQARKLDLQAVLVNMSGQKLSRTCLCSLGAMHLPCLLREGIAWTMSRHHTSQLVNHCEPHYEKHARG